MTGQSKSPEKGLGDSSVDDQRPQFLCENMSQLSENAEVWCKLIGPTDETTSMRKGAEDIAPEVEAKLNELSQLINQLHGELEKVERIRLPTGLPQNMRRYRAI